MKTILLALVASLAISAQQGASPVTIATPSTAEQKLFYYDGSSNLTYICTARQKQSTTTRTRAASTLTSIAVATNVGTVTTSTAHGLYVGAQVTISGATVDTDLNGVYVVASIPSTTTYTTVTVNVGDATYTDAGLSISTNFPLTTLAEWAIQVFKYSTTLIGSNWAASNTSYNLICDNKSNY